MLLVQNSLKYLTQMSFHTNHFFIKNNHDLCNVAVMKLVECPTAF